MTSKLLRLNQNLSLSESEFEEWKESAVTKEFFKLLLREAAVRRGMLANGGLQYSDKLKEDYLKLITIAETFEGIPEVSFEDFLQEDA